MSMIYFSLALKSLLFIIFGFMGARMWLKHVRNIANTAQGLGMGLIVLLIVGLCWGYVGYLWLQPDIISLATGK